MFFIAIQNNNLLTIVNQVDSKILYQYLCPLKNNQYDFCIEHRLPKTSKISIERCIGIRLSQGRNMDGKEAGKTSGGSDNRICDQAS